MGTRLCGAFHKVGQDGSGKCTLIHADAAAAAYACCTNWRMPTANGSTGWRGYTPEATSGAPCSSASPVTRTTQAMTYVAGDRHVDAARVPFDWYRDLVVAGALEHQLPARHIEEFAAGAGDVRPGHRPRRPCEPAARTIMNDAP